MTNDMTTLRTLVEKAPDADVLREMSGFAAHRLMELEVEGLTGAGWGEKNPERLAHRNGYHDRAWETRAGRWSCASRSSGRAPASPDFPSPAALPRRRSPR